jgi:hypothetical protein
MKPLPGEAAARGTSGAAELAALLSRQGGEASLRVTEVLDAVGHYTLRKVDDVAAVLEAASIASEPPFDGDLKRHYTVRLTLPEARDRCDASSITRRWLLPDGSVCNEAGPLPADAILWVDVSAEEPDDIRRVIGPTLAEVGEELSPGELERMERHLSSRDYRPALHVYRADGAIRSMSCFVASTDELVDADPTDASQPKTGRLTFWPLEMSVGERFLLTVRRRGERVVTSLAERRSVTDVEDADRCSVLGSVELFEQVQRRWSRAVGRHTAGHPGSAGDAALLILHWMADSYLDSVRTMEAWLSQWELQVFDRQGEPERGTLMVLREMLAETEARGGVFAYPHGGDPVTGWLPGVRDVTEAQHVHSVLTRVLRMLLSVQERVRDRIDAVSDLDQQRSRRRVERLGFLILFPTLIAGVFGANTAIPGGGTWAGFGGMLAAMFILTILAYRVVVGTGPGPARHVEPPPSRERRLGRRVEGSEVVARRRLARALLPRPRAAARKRPATGAVNRSSRAVLEDP